MNLRCLNGSLVLDSFLFVVEIKKKTGVSDAIFVAISCNNPFENWTELPDRSEEDPKIRAAI